ncbi:hypothetical protein B0H14DRAFT_2644807 [Mycena olivaceomarginata]|nr:hypothetical protein B0H14DRAFT_2644807 [Mycena olivaceomarginata]
MPKPLVRHSPPRSWYDDVPDIPIVHIVYAAPSTPPPRDLSAIRSPAFHPWRTIRRRNHRLLPQRREPQPFPKSLPRRPVVSAPHVDVLAVNDHPVSLPPPPSLAPTHRFVPLSTADDDSIPVLVLLRPVPLPYDPYYFIPSDFRTQERSLPGETFYGPVQSGLALVCAREYPWIAVARSTISEIAWGVHHPEECDEREEVLDLLPPDQLVFLMVLTEICRLEPDFTGFVEPAIADFVNAWLDHCCPPPPPPSVANIPVPSMVPARMTSYGQVRSDLALACASEQPQAAFALSNVSELVFGPYPRPEDQDYLAQLPADQLVFLCTLVEFVALEPVLAEFLHPAIISFAMGWVTHCQHQDSFA